MPHVARDNLKRRSTRHGAFSLAELLVVVGVISLLVALLLPPLQEARRAAMRTQCAAQLSQLGHALAAANNDFRYYPLWDDAGNPRFTWIDVLIELEYFPNRNAAYCPEDLRPDPINLARALEREPNLVYPERPGLRGVDYSYGIGRTLSAGGWNWQPGTGDGLPRRFDNPQDRVSGRVLAGDGTWTYLYNMSGRALVSGVWNDRFWYDNTVAWRHLNRSANLLKQDGHVDAVGYNVTIAHRPVDTGKHFVWFPNEPLHVGPSDSDGKNYYPDTPPPNYQSKVRGSVYPDLLVPYYYTINRRWTHIHHKAAVAP